MSVLHPNLDAAGKVPAPKMTSVSTLISRSDHIPLAQKVLFSAGSMMDFASTGLVTSVLWMPYFNIGLGISPALLGVILMVLRGWDAFVDPVMGNLSDNARTRWGRRRPFMAVGALLTAILFPLIWRVPPGLHTTGQALYLCIVGMVFFAAFSCWSMPYYGMQLELTPNYDERTRLMAWGAFFSKIIAFLGGWTMAVVTGKWFADAATGRPDIVAGVKVCSIFIAVIIAAIGLLPALFVRERYYAAEASHQEKEPLWQSLRESMQCGPLWILIAISFFLLLGSSMIATLGQYVNIYAVNHGQLAYASVVAGWISSGTFITGMVSIPFWTWMGEKFDKKTIVGVLLGGSVFGHLLNFFCLRPDLPYLQIIPAMFLSMVYAAVWLFLPSMKADIADYDELRTMRRREGSLNAFYSWFCKAAMTLALGLGGLAIQATGFHAALPEQSPEVLQRMKWIYLLLPAAIWSVPIVFIRLYPLNRERMAEIRSELEVRRGRL